MADDVFDIVTKAVEAEKARVERQLETVRKSQRTNDRRTSTTRLLSRLLAAGVSALLGQVSNKQGYSEAEISAATEAMARAGLSHAAGTIGESGAGTVPSTDLHTGLAQESLNSFYASLSVDPMNVFVLPRLAFDAMATRNVQRARALNEAIEVVGLLKLQHDAIPPAYYDAGAMENLVTVRPQLQELVRVLTIACTAVTSGEQPAELTRSIENDLESAIRFLSRESVYDASQFSPTEYLALVRRCLAVADALEPPTEFLTQARTNVAAFQVDLPEQFGASSPECGTLVAARATIESVTSRIEALVGLPDDRQEPSAVEATREFVLQLTAALAGLQTVVQRRAAVEDVLTVQPSTERTKLEAAQTALAAVPALSAVLSSDLRTYARLAERRLVSPTVSTQFASLFSSLSSALTAEFSKGEAIQAALNGYDVDLAAEPRSAVVTAVRDLSDLGLDRVADAIVVGDMSTAFGQTAATASLPGLAAQQVALAIAGASTGSSLALGGCILSQALSQSRMGRIIREVQGALVSRAASQASLKDAIERRIDDLARNRLERLSRFLAEITSIRNIEGC